MFIPNVSTLIRSTCFREKSMGKRIKPRLGESEPWRGDRLWVIGSLELDERMMQLRLYGERCDLEPKPLAVLIVLMRNAGRLVTGSELAAHAWGGRPISDEVIGQAIARVRRVLRDSHPNLITTVHGWGYRLDAIPEARPASVEHQLPATRRLSEGAAHPARRCWKIIAPHPTASLDCWLTAHCETGLQRILVPLCDRQQVQLAHQEILHCRKAMAGGRFEGLLAHAMELDVDQTGSTGHLEYPAHLQSLPTWLAREGGLGSFTQHARLGLVRTIAKRVAHFHAQGVYFGRLTPASLLLGYRGEEDIRIFLPAATAHVAAAAPMLYSRNWTDRGVSYRAPELRGNDLADGAADVYSLGVILLEMVLGDWGAVLAPDWGQSVQCQHLRAVIARATNLDPGERHADARELASAIESLLFADGAESMFPVRRFGLPNEQALLPQVRVLN